MKQLKGAFLVGGRERKEVGTLGPSPSPFLAPMLHQMDLYGVHGLKEHV